MADYEPSPSSPFSVQMFNDNLAWILLSPTLSSFVLTMDEYGEQCTIVFALIFTEPAREFVCMCVEGGWGAEPKEDRMTLS